MIVSIDSHWIYFKTSKFHAEQLGAVWNDRLKCYRIYNTLGALRELYYSFKDDELIQIGKQKKEKYDQLMQIKYAKDAEGDTRLRPYQRADVHFLEQIPHGAIFNEQRTGKTVTALTLLDRAKFPLNVVVAPASIILQWDSEVKKWTTDSVVYVNKGTPKERVSLYNYLYNYTGNKKVFFITSYNMVRSDLDHFIKLLDKFDTSLTVDEAHRLGNRKTQQTKAIHALGKKAKKRLALTGTPTLNHGSDIWGILHFLYPSRFTSYWQFVDRYFHVNDTFYGKHIGDYKRKDELVQILEAISVQRKRRDVMEWLPKKQYITYEVELNKKQRKAYEDVLKTFEYVENGEIKVDASTVLAQLTRLRQIILSPELLDIHAKSAKEEWLLDFLKDNKEPTIIFSNFTSYLKRLHKKIKGSVLLHGELSTEEKQRNVTAFQKGEKGINILLSNIEAGGQGWTIDRATTTIFLDRHFTPAINEQAEDRMVSTSKENITTSTVIDVIAKNTVDERIFQILKEKKSITQVINDYGLKAFITQ